MKSLEIRFAAAGTNHIVSLENYLSYDGSSMAIIQKSKSGITVVDDGCLTHKKSNRARHVLAS